MVTDVRPLSGKGMEAGSMSPQHSDWPMKAMVQKKNESGEWEDYGQIAGVNYAEVWIAKREDPSQWRVIEILVPEEEEEEEK